MCGLNIVLRCPETSNPLALVEKMNSVTGHRGLRSRSWTWGKTAVGHVRLPIQGTGEEFDHPQTVNSLEGAMVGEVFNFREIQPGAPSDLPVALARLADRGWEAFNEFDGFFAMALFDGNCVTIATDDLAKKPLYVLASETTLAVSSELRALVPMSNGELDRQYLATVQKWGYDPEARLTPFAQIWKMVPGHLMTFTADGDAHLVFEKRWCDLSPLNPTDLREHIEKAVSRRLISDLPVSILASGGLDSTIVLELARREADVRVYHADNDEAEYLNLLDLQPGQRTLVELDDINDAVALYWNETPVDLGSMVPQLALAMALRRQAAHVALSGDGADELFGGYRRAKEYDSQFSDLHHEVVSYHLPRLDKMMMAGTVELRCPFLARDVVRRALSLPWAVRHEKEHLKELFKDIVPKEILEREKWALKIHEVRQDPIKRRRRLVEQFCTETAPMLSLGWEHA